MQEISGFLLPRCSQLSTAIHPIGCHFGSQSGCAGHPVLWEPTDLISAFMPFRLRASGSTLCVFRDLMTSAAQSQPCSAHERHLVLACRRRLRSQDARALGNDFAEQLWPSIKAQVVYLKDY
jgi:hypothetical protein